MFIFFFFFQAEDGIRDFHVTGVQTCALPISTAPCTSSPSWSASARDARKVSPRSEERRVGKSVDLGGRRIIKKKKIKKKKTIDSAFSNEHLHELTINDINYK